VLEKVAKADGLIPLQVTLDEINKSEDYARILSKLQSQIKTEQDGKTNIINVPVSANGLIRLRALPISWLKKYRELKAILSKNRRISEQNVLSKNN